ncbi:MAG: hypothetical protein AAFQ82_04325, partial [Myxococcota bacterium]
MSSESQADWAQINHGRLRIEIPQTWTDGTTVSLSGPSRTLATSALATTGGREYSSNVSLSAFDAPPGLTPRGYLGAVNEQLRRQGVVHRQLEERPVTIAGSEGLGVVRCVENDGAWVRQLQAVANVEDVFVTVTLSTLDGAPTSEWAELEMILGT